MFSRNAVVLAIILSGATAAQAGPDEIPLKDHKNDHDHIRITVEGGKVAMDEVEIVLTIAPKIHMFKKVRAFTSTGDVGTIECRDDTKQASFKLKTATLARLEIAKGVNPFNREHWDYKISPDFRTMGGSRITLSWEWSDNE